MKFAGLFCLCSIALLFTAGVFSTAKAETIRLQPVADTSLVESAPDNNLGGCLFVNAGRAGSSGARNRGLYKFDFSSIPVSAKIKSVSMTLDVTREPDMGGPFSSFALHRMLKPWGEGDKDSTAEGSPGIGFPATINEATWNSPLALTTNTWTFPGASNDYAAAISSSTFVYGVASSPYTFDSTLQMLADVQMWLNNPSSNFGWLLKTESEDVLKTARSFGSREFATIDTNSPPYVEVKFVLAPVISSAQISNGQFQFLFLGQADQEYIVEFKNALSTNGWTPLTNFTASNATNHLVSDRVSTNARFYRVVAP